MRAIRIKRKLRLRPAAALIGCHWRYLSHMELEQRNASPIMLQQVADAYGVSPDAIRKHTAQVAA